MNGKPPPERVRLDKWLWAARMMKTRALAVDEIDKGRVQVNGQPAKAGRDLRPGDRVQLRLVGYTRELVVLALSDVRGPAPVAQTLYEETPDSLAARDAAAARRRMGVEPALAMTDGRPTKKDRRELTDWQRWSASLDDEQR